MQHTISISSWVSLPNEVRYRIRSIFNIPRSSNTVVNDGKIETDGTTHEDFKHLTTEKMQVFLHNSSTDFHKLFDMVVASVNDEISNKKLGQVVTVSSEAPITVTIDEPIKRKYVKRNATKK